MTLDIDVIGNQISGSNFNSGVAISQSGSGSVVARVINNVVTGQLNNAGGPAGISLRVTGGSGNFDVINNTVAYNDTGVLVSGLADLGATLSGRFANNIVAFNTGTGLSIDPNFSTTFVNQNNLVHGNLSNSYDPGVGTVTVDPLFISMADLRLQSISPARDSGDSSFLPSFRDC